MRNALVRFALAVIALVLCASQDRANAIDIVPPALIDKWLSLAQQIRDLGFCRYKPNDPALSLSRSVQTSFARGVNEETIEQRTSELEGTLKRCSFCRVYAKAAVAASYDNILYQCGLKGPLWSTNEAYHFDGCMTVEHGTVSGFGVAAIAGIESSRMSLEELETAYMNPDTGARTQAIAECKLTHKRRDCLSCHSSNSASASPAKASPAAFQSLPKSSRGSFDQPITNRPSGGTGTKSGNEPSQRATAPKGGNTGAMDRLSGDSQLPGSGSGSNSGDGNRRVPAGGGASTVAKPVTNTPAPSQTIDFGVCANCGRPAAPR